MNFIRKHIFADRYLVQPLLTVRYLNLYLNEKERDTWGALHYAKLTDQRSVGIPEENETTFPD